MRFASILTRAATIAAAAISMPASATAFPPGLTEAVQAFDAAQVRGDGAALDALLADDYLLLNGDGSEEDRTAFIKDFTDPSFHLDPIRVGKPVVRIWQGGAVMGGIVHLTGLSAGKPFSQCIRFSDIWALKDGAWKVEFTHVSRPPVDACSKPF